MPQRARRGPKRLTPRLIERLGRERGKDYVVMDTRTPGFGVRVLPSGRRFYFAQYRVPGARQSLNARRVTIGNVEHLSLETARRKARDEVFTPAEAGRDPALNRATVAELVPHYLDAVAAERKATTAQGYRRKLEHGVLPVIGPLRAAAVQRQDVEKIRPYLKHLATKRGIHQRAGGKYTFNRTLAVTSSFFRWCADNGYREAGSNPCKGIRRATEEPRRRYLSPDEARRLGAALRDANASLYAKAAIRVMLFSGMRAGEVLSLAWDDVDLSTGAVRLRDAKTAERERVLSAPALAVLADLPREAGRPHCFPSDARRGAHLTDIGRTWDKVRAAAGLKDFRLHDLRHSFASAALSSGATLAVIGELLGHRTAQTTKRYAHLHADARRAAAEKASGALASWLDGDETTVTQLPRARRR